MSKRKTATDRIVQRIDAKIAVLQAARAEVLSAAVVATVRIKKPRTLAAVVAADAK